MSRSLNKVMIIGNISTDVTLKQTPQGTPVCNFSIATNEYNDTVEYHRCVLWRKLAEIAGQYLKKGSLVYIEGKLATRSYEKEGQKHYSTEIVADQMTMLGSKDLPKNGESGENLNQGPPAFDIPDTDFKDDDMPF